MSILRRRLMSGGGKVKPFYLYKDGVFDSSFQGWTNKKEYSDGSYTEYSDRFVLYYPWHASYSFWSLSTPVNLTKYSKCYFEYSLDYSSRGSMPYYSKIGTADELSYRDRSHIAWTTGSWLQFGSQKCDHEIKSFDVIGKNYFGFTFGLANTITVYKIWFE